MHGLNRVRLEFLIPSRGLFGYRSEFMTDTRGEGIMSAVYEKYEPVKGDIPHRSVGALVCFEAGEATSYGLFNTQERGTLFITAQTQVYKGMRSELFHHPDLDRCLGLCGDQNAFLIRYLTRLSNQFIELFLKGNSQYMHRYFGFGLESRAAKYLAEPSARMLAAISADAELTDCQRALLKNAFFNAFRQQLGEDTQWLQQAMIASAKLAAQGDTPEQTVALETAHQWWYAVVGSDGFNQAWQDEALSQFSLLDYWETRNGASARAELQYSLADTAMSVCGKRRGSTASAWGSAIPARRMRAGHMPKA